MIKTLLKQRKSNKKTDQTNLKKANMKNKYLNLLLIMALFIGCVSKPPQLGEASIDEVIAAMTLVEKARMVIGAGMEGVTGDSAVVGETQSIVPGAAGLTYAIPRLGIPSIVLADGPAGLRISSTRNDEEGTFFCTQFPIGNLLSSTWDQQLVFKVGETIGNEALEYGVDVLLAPALNIHRHPLCGRNFEYFSEDPIVSGKITTAYLSGVQQNGVGTSVKHFAANNQETNRMDNDSRVSPRALREIYLKGFEMAVKEGKPWTIMSSYNYLNGVYTSENPELLTTLLREEWGYEGVVMSDWFGGKSPIAQMQAGNDMIQPGLEKQYVAIYEGVQNGQLDESILDRNIKNILNLVLKAPRFNKYKFSNQPDLKSHAELSRQAAAEGMVLLKNEKETLPLTANIKKIALFGSISYNFIAGGTGSGNVNRAYTVSLLDALQNAGYELHEDLLNLYQQHIDAFKLAESKREKNKMDFFRPETLPEELEIPNNQIKQLAKETDVALITIGRSSGEFADRTSSEFFLKENELQLLRNISQAFRAAGKKVIVILNIGGVIETDSWQNNSDAILLSWLAGQEGGNSVVDILSGKVSPSGKLPMTFPRSLTDVPSSVNFPMEGKPGSEKEGERKNWDYTNYEEDIYVGYRYYDTFKKEVSYPFGFGMSYTSFIYSSPTIKQENNQCIISVDIQNIGKCAGKEVVQLYVTAPKNESYAKPLKELKDFIKTKKLEPGETTTVTFTLNTENLASYDESQHAWVVDEGLYQFLIGSSSKDIHNTLKIEVASAVIPTKDVLNLQQPINLLDPK